ncbi:GNAT family N-acetyltransferase [Roseibium aggregatum]|uniref:GNAT family N-acetyltransferase n=1 Tax=Roseibium aggregatum TaxID=187304 RepID=UPI003A97674E
MNATADNRLIRPATEGDLDALFDICLKTADGGTDGSAFFSDKRLPGYVWSVPYFKFEPECAFVLVENGRTIGYVLGAPDTARFEETLEQHWWPDIRRMIADMTPKLRDDAKAFHRINHPERTPQWLLADYPAHLHINILPGAQSSGWGRRMIDTVLDALAKAGAPGVHLGLHPQNERAKGFYSHLGFEDISRDGHVLFARCLGR